MSLTIWGRRSSFNVQKVLWLAGELNLTYGHVPAGGDFGGLDDPAFLARNPHGRVPVIEDDGTVVWESHAILRYLAAKYGGAAYWSEDPAERSQSDRWLEWTQAALQPEFLIGVFWGFYRTPSEQRNWPAIRESVTRTGKHFQLLDSILEGRDFLSGRELGLADIPAGALLYRYFNLEIERPSLPNVEAWRRRLEDRAAYREHVMIPFDDLKGRLH